MVEIEIQINKVQMAAARRALAKIPRGFDKAMLRAINKTGKTYLSKVIRAISKSSGIKGAALRKKIKWKAANRNRLEGRFRILSGAFPAIDVKGAKALKRKGVVVPKPGSGVDVIPRGFKATMRSGHKGFFKRQRIGGDITKRLPITEITGPSALSTVEKDKGLLRKFESETAGIAEKELLRQVTVLLNRATR